MGDRRPLRWLIGMGAFAVLSSGLAVALIWWASELQAQVYGFYSDNPVTADEATYRYWESIGSTAYTLQTIAMPLFLTAFVAVFALLGVLARTQDVHAARAAQAGATAAS